MRNVAVVPGALVFVLALALAQPSKAGGLIRADLPCPYGGAGAPNPTFWSATSGSSPYNAGLTTPYTATLAAGSSITVDDFNVAITGATQYDTYSAAIPAASLCTATDTSAFNVNPNGPMEQVIAYNLSSGGTLGLASGDKEIEFNYNLTFNPTLATTTGTASFTLGGVTYSSVGPFLPTSTSNDFLFDSSGKLLGAIGLDGNGNAVVNSGVPIGWTTSGGGGGTVTAPEMDANSAVGALTLLAGCLLVARGSRRGVAARYPGTSTV